MNTESPLANPTGNVERCLGHTVARQFQGVGRHTLSQHGQHLGGGAKETIGRHQAVDSLVGTLEVIVVDEMPDSAAGVLQIEKHRRFDTLPPQRSPETLDLAQGLRPLRFGHDVLDPPLVHFTMESARAAPGDILAAVVGEYLLGRAVGYDRRPHDLQDQGRRLAGVDPVAGEESAVVVHEGHHVNPPVLPLQDEGEQIGLPKLVGRGPLELPLLIGMRMGGHLLHLVARLVQDPRHGPRRGRQGWPAEQHVADPLATPFRIGLLEHEDCPLGQLMHAAALGAAPGLVHQPARPQLVELLLPGVERVLGKPHQGGEIASRQAAPLPGVEDQ